MNCKRCGQCCYYEINGIRKRCRFLIRITYNKTLCRVYGFRLGRVIDYDKKNNITIRCINRVDDDRIFLGCPLNNQKLKTDLSIKQRDDAPLKNE